MALDVANERIVFSSASSGTNVLAVTDMNRFLQYNRQPSGIVDRRWRTLGRWPLRRVRSSQGGDLNIWIVDSNGAYQRQLTHGNVDEKATFSPDGRWVFYQHWSEGKIHLFKIPF